MKKSLILFIVLALLLVVAKIAYNKYCASKLEGCKNQVNGKEKYDVNQGLPKEGIDW